MKYLKYYKSLSRDMVVCVDYDGRLNCYIPDKPCQASVVQYDEFLLHYAKKYKEISAEEAVLEMI